MTLPKLHLRDLFWLVLVCALAVGWWVDRRTYVPRPLTQEDFEGDFKFLIPENSVRGKELHP